MFVSDTKPAVQLIPKLCEALSRRSFQLSKFISNSKEVLTAVPERACRKSLRSGMEHRERYIRVPDNKKRVFTRRGILSDVSSLYNPMGFAAPFVLPAKRLLL